MEFESFPKIARFNREIIVTEKIDGTNAQIFISDDVAEIRAGSRNRWITPEDDNFGFAGWVEKNKEQLLKLGPGRHYGEWWGAGIQRRYGLTDKRFSLFNVSRWGDASARPPCCSVVPVLYQGNMEDFFIMDCIERLKKFGSLAASGFMDPEGIVIYHTASKQLFKKTCKDDEKAKSEV